MTSTRTASVRHSPAPAVSVSARWSAGESSGARAAAMPPCAHGVAPASSRVFVTSSTRPSRRHSSAAVSPAMPLPTTITSAYVVQPGAGATSAAGTSRSVG